MLDLEPKHFRELKKLLYIIHYTFYIICYMVDDMNIHERYEQYEQYERYEEF
jgi:hypothetical protein